MQFYALAAHCRAVFCFAFAIRSFTSPLPFYENPCNAFAILSLTPLRLCQTLRDNSVATLRCALPLLRLTLNCHRFSKQRYAFAALGSASPCHRSAMHYCTIAVDAKHSLCVALCCNSLPSPIQALRCPCLCHARLRVTYPSLRFSGLRNTFAPH